VGLSLAEGDAQGLDAIALSGVADQPAPAAADVQQPLTGAQAQLAADQLQFGLLRLVEGLAARREVGAGVDHAPVQPQGIEVVAQIIMVAHGGAVAFQRMAHALAPEPPVGSGDRHVIGGGEGLQAQQHPRQAPRRRQQRAEIIGHPAGGAQIALDLDVATQIGLGQCQLRRRHEHPP
jgi:hypothetical protein